MNLPDNPRVDELSWHPTGLAELDEVLEASLASEDHFILKSEIIQEIDAPIGSPPKLKVSQEVTSLQELETLVPEGVFTTPECPEISKEQLKEQADDLMWLLYGKQVE